MTTEQIGLLIQGGLVGVFAAFVLFLRKDERAERKERDEGWQKFISDQNDKLNKSLEAMIALLSSHDKKTDVAISTMVERTRKQRQAQ
jgi:seryl-tRNA(Sec) selenium transferase